MKIHVFGKDKNKTGELKTQLEKFNLEYSENNPDLVICYGGDGTFLIAERVFPGIPKIFLKGSEVSCKGEDIDIREALEKYLKGDYRIEEIRKLKATYKGIFESRELVGTNDIVIRNTLPTEAIRFRIKIDGNDSGQNFVGDGVVVSTPYGSTGYFDSITGKKFEKGIGLAFNNVKNNSEEKYLKDSTKIEVEISRGPGVLVADNNRDYVNLEKGDRVLIEQIGEVAKRVVF